MHCEVIELLDALDRQLHEATALCNREDVTESQLRQQIELLRTQLVAEHHDLGSVAAARKIVLRGRLNALEVEGKQLERTLSQLVQQGEQYQHSLPGRTQTLDCIQAQCTNLCQGKSRANGWIYAAMRNTDGDDTATKREMQGVMDERSPNIDSECARIDNTREEIATLQSRIMMVTKNRDALNKLVDRQASAIDEAKSALWETKSKVFALIKDNEMLEKEIREVVTKKDAATAAAFRERYTRLQQRQNSGSKMKRQPRSRKNTRPKPPSITPERAKSVDDPPAKRMKTSQISANEFLVPASSLLESHTREDSSDNHSSTEFSLSDD